MANTYLPKMAFHDDKIPGYPHDLAKAKALVAESAGKERFSDEILRSTGDPVGSPVAQLVASDLAKIGGQIKITQVDPGLATQRVEKQQDHDMTKSYYTTDIIDPDELTSSAVQSDGGTQAVWTSYRNPQGDALCKHSEVETDKAKRQQIYSQIQQLVSDDAHFIYLYYPAGRTATTKAIQNVHYMPAPPLRG